MLIVGCGTIGGFASLILSHSHDGPILVSDRNADRAALALVGIFHERMDFDPDWIVEREVALVGCHAFGDELPEAIGLLAGLAAQLTRLIDDEIGIEAIPAAYARLAGGAAQGLKTVILPHPTGNPTAR